MKTLTPLPEDYIMPERAPLTMSFPDAMKKVLEGQSVTRASWGTGDYCLLKDDWLTIYTKGDFHSWLVSAGDMEAQDWIIYVHAN